MWFMIRLATFFFLIGSYQKYLVTCLDDMIKLKYMHSLKNRPIATKICPFYGAFLKFFNYYYIF